MEFEINRGRPNNYFESADGAAFLELVHTRREELKTRFPDGVELSAEDIRAKEEMETVIGNELMDREARIVIADPSVHEHLDLNTIVWIKEITGKAMVSKTKGMGGQVGRGKTRAA